MNRIFGILAAGLVAITFACGGDDDGGGGSAPPELVEALADVCTETADVATDDILQVDEPQAGDEVGSPIVVTGSAIAFQDTVWVSVVKADGEHVIDYPGRTTELGAEDTLTPYEISVPFTVIEETPACLWVYRRDVVEPADAIRIPVVLLPTATPVVSINTMRSRAIARCVASALIVALAVLLLACGDDDDAVETTATTTVAEATAAATATDAPTESPVVTPVNVCQTNPDPATDDTNLVDQPGANEQLMSPIAVTGQIAAFEAAFKMTLFDANGGVIAEQNAMSSEGQTLAPFQASIAFEVQEATPACLWVYAASARDGNPIDVVQLPLTLLPSQ